MSKEYADILIRIRRRDEDAAAYPVEAELDDGSSFDGGQLRLDQQFREALLVAALDPEGYGLELFHALFSGPIRRAYYKATGRAEAQTGGRLRVRLRVDNDAAELHALPWERLYHVHQGQAVPLATSALTPFSRYVGLETPEPQPVTERPVRLLVAISNPRDLPAGLSPIEVEREVENLGQALGDLRRGEQVQVTLMPGRSGLSSALRAQLEGEGYRIHNRVTSLDNILRLLPGCHAFHFIGHGLFQRRGEHGEGSAALYLEREDGRWEAVKDDDLVTKLTAAAPLPHLVFLSACEGAKREAGAAHPFVGLGPKLVKAGVPAVVAMQDMVPMALARQLTEDFYRCLAEHGTIDRALNQARLLLFEREGIDWAIPVLFMRLEQGQLFATEPARPTEALRFTVPFMRNPDFVGREEDLERLHQALMGEGPVGIRPAGLTGMGGIGKTQLAVEYAYRYRDSYSGGVFWINAAEPLGQGFARLGWRLRPATADRTLDEQVRTAAGYLREHPDSLLILDNLADPAALNRPVSADLVPAAVPCRVLFTTRRRDLGRFTPIEVTVLPEDAALQLLLRHPARQPILNPAHPQHECARTICAILGYLPLALEVAGAHLGRWLDAPLDAYRRELLERGALPVLDDPRARLRPEDLPTRHDAAVAATLASQWETLESDDARLLLRVAGQLPEAAMIQAARLGLLAGLDASDAGFFGSPLMLALRELWDASLVEELREGQVRLHPLVREFAARQTPEEEAPVFRQWCAANLAAAYQDIATLEDHCARRDVDALQEDLITALGLLPQTSEVSKDFRSLATFLPTFSALNPLLHLLRREAHNLRSWDRQQNPAFFAQQVHKRAVDIGLTHLVDSAAARLAQLGKPYLSLLWRAGPQSPELELTLTGHSGPVNSVVVTSDGLRAISASDDRTLKVWDLRTGREVQTLIGHKDKVNAVAITSDDHTIISGSNDGILKIWDLRSGQEILTLTSGSGRIYRIGGDDSYNGLTITPGAVNAVAITPDNQSAICGYGDWTLKVWDIETWEEIRVLEGHTEPVCSIAITPDGRYAISAAGHDLIRVWDLRTWQKIRTLRGYARSANDVAITPDGSRVISTSNPYPGVLDFQTGREVLTLIGYDGERLVGHTGNVLAVAVTSGGQYVISASEDRTLIVWELQTGQVVRTLRGHTAAVTAVAATPDGNRVVSASKDGTLGVWNLQIGEKNHAAAGHQDWVQAMAITPDSERVISASQDRTLKVWDLQTGKEEHTIVGHNGQIVLVSADSRQASSISIDFTDISSRTLKIWDLQTGQVVTTIDLDIPLFPMCAMAFTPDGRCVISAANDNTLKIFDLQTGQEKLTLAGHKDEIQAVAVTRDGRYAISASRDCTLRLWDLRMGRSQCILTGHRESVYAVAITPDSRRAISASNDGTSRIWDLKSGQTLYTIASDEDRVGTVALSADGNCAILTSDRTLKIWDLRKDRVLTTVALEGTLWCTAAALDGVTVLAGDIIGNVYCLRYIDSNAS